MIKLKKLNIEDEWGRPLYKGKAGYYCDVNLGRGDNPDIHYKGSKDGEPSHRIYDFEITEEP